MHFIRSFVLLLIVLCPTIFPQKPVSVPDYSPLIEKYRTLFSEEMKQNKTAGISIALVDGDSLIWCEGFGIYDTTNKTTITGHTPLLLGSITKTFTALAVMQLAEKGLIDLDAPLRKYLPEFNLKTHSGSPDDITVRQLMTHHAGVPDFMKDKFGYKNKYFTTVMDIINDDYATYPPGIIQSYSNSGVLLLGVLIERVSGKSYYDYLKENILNPAGMNESGFFLDETAPLSVRLGYNLRMEEKPELPVFDAPAGCIYASAYDMAKYISIFLSKGYYKGKKIADSSTLNDMMTIQNKNVFLDFGNPIGLIWSVYYNSAGKSIKHGGSTMYHRSGLSISPECGLGVVMLSNSAGASRIVMHTDYDIIADAVKIKGVRPEWKEQPPSKNILHSQHNCSYTEGQRPKPVKMTREELSNYAGRYATFGMYMDLSVADSNCLVANIMGQKFYMLPVGNDEFGAAGGPDYTTMSPNQRFYFENYNGSQLLISVDPWGNHNVLSEKIKITKPTQIWMDRSGSYDTGCTPGSHQVLLNPRLEFNDGLLLLRVNMNLEQPGPSEMVIPFRLLDDNTAVAYGYCRFGGTTLRFEKGGDGHETMKILGFICTKK